MKMLFQNYKIKVLHKNRYNIVLRANDGSTAKPNEVLFPIKGENLFHFQAFPLA